MKKLIIISNDKINLVPEHQIQFCKSDNCYTTIHTIHDLELVVCKSLSKISDKLNPEIFIRVSQSYIVNINFIASIHKKEKLIEMISNIKIPFTLSLKLLVDKLKGSEEEYDSKLLN